MRRAKDVAVGIPARTPPAKLEPIVAITDDACPTVDRAPRTIHLAWALW